MNTVKVKTQELLESVRGNREEHRDVFKRAFDSYRSRVIEETERNLSNMKLGQAITTFISMEAPQDHTKDYDRIIKMLEMTIDAGEHQIEITQHEFAQYVMDDWGWKEEWINSTAAYLAQP